MACAVVRILDEVLLDHPDLSEITLWSDSCVSQNKNSVMAMALTEFMKKHPNLKIIIQKFSEAGHSSIQEVDNVHSVIERHLRHQEVYSPVGLLKKLNTIKNCKVIRVSDFLTTTLLQNRSTILIECHLNRFGNLNYVRWQAQ